MHSTTKNVPPENVTSAGKSPENNKKKFAVINPCRMCQPMGAVQALLGIEGAMPLIHGSQGCSTYMRFQLCRHFREPINVSSTSMSESTVVYGGEKNLLKALETMKLQYNPTLIGVTSSCLTETIGDDVKGIIRKFHESYKDHSEELPPILSISTPSYSGSHIEGYDKTIKSLLESLALSPESSDKNNVINVIPGNLAPADVEEVKDILHLMELDNIILTDTSESLHAPLNGSIEFLPSSGTTLDEIRQTANSKITLTLSKHADSGGIFLKKRFGVPHVTLPLPVGLENTDLFISTLSSLEDVENIPPVLERDRGRLLDALVDSQAYNYGRKVAIYGDPDLVSGMVSFLTEMGMEPAIIATGTKSNKFSTDIQQIMSRTGHDPLIINGGDLYDLQQQVKKTGVDLLIGNSYGARIALDENIPLFRVGFPIFDRVGAQRIRILGYKGSLNLLDQLTNTIIQHYYDEAGYELMDGAEN
ncbi:nitrogenase iron-molybdenum cofactor biosynthesis protein NifN [Methanobacterium sp.]|uniref:nitrogenase iron-molybdenum cofactor biosynthesis protein NifN n=1 Tax=Methanobacterium sp. TaxID=2164 RepID=UPI0025E822E6|nr:nitrogenase iron-molybdenum cofactor biosynthesis protein NifN [Methanobacterium sp.]MBI5459923.1 nitrogenase iron-molybdenum cofactor biosynthesis protein NifN [Methanobacterium sp.]